VAAGGGLGYRAVKAGEAVKDALEGGSAMSKIEERQAERKQGNP